MRAFRLWRRMVRLHAETVQHHQEILKSEVLR